MSCARYNALVSALLISGSVPRRAFDRASTTGRVLLSTAVIAELDDVLRRPKFNRYLSEELRIEFLTALVRDCVLVEIVTNVKACRDSDDDEVLNLAVSGNATVIITGDADLLVLHPFRGIPIISPADFLRDGSSLPQPG